MSLLRRSAQRFERDARVAIEVPRPSSVNGVYRTRQTCLTRIAENTNGHLVGAKQP